MKFSFWNLLTWRICLLMQETWVQALDWAYTLEKGLATHSSILAWKFPWTEEPGGLQSMRSQRVGKTQLTFTSSFQYLKRMISEFRNDSNRDFKWNNFKFLKHKTYASYNLIQFESNQKQKQSSRAPAWNDTQQQASVECTDTGIESTL